MEKTKIKERGWAGHHKMSNMCYFRRNTLVSNGDSMYVVSTVGNMGVPGKIGASQIAKDKMYETCVFKADPKDMYLDGIMNERISVNQAASIKSVSHKPPGSDNIANDMHDSIVNEIVERIENGEL